MPPKRIQHHQCSTLTGNAHPESNREEISDKSKMRNGLLEKRRPNSLKVSMSRETKKS